MSIVSPWLDVAALVVEILAHLTEIAKAPREVLKSKPLIRPEELHDTNSHLCTLCLQMVRAWSKSNTMAGGLTELAGALAETLVGLDQFIKSNWNVNQLGAIA
jgi:hypothetical protein